MEPPRGYTMDPSFSIPTAKEPPSQPAMPPSGDALERADRLKREANKLEEQRQRADERNTSRAQEIRTQALELAIQWRLGAEQTDVIASAEVFAAYIKDGTKP